MTEDHEAPRPAWDLRGVRTLLRDTRAAAALEFALVGPVFLLLVCLILELALALFTQSVMNNALQGAARLVRIGQVTTSSAFVGAVCDEVGNVLVSSCSANMQYYVASSGDFGSLAPKTGTLPDSFTPGTSGADMLAQIAYKRPTIIPWVAEFLGDSQLLTSTVVFQNEPY